MGVRAELLCQHTDKELVKKIHDDLCSPKSDLRLLYATPERVVKSKTLISRLEKAHKQGLLQRIVIDEAHCISQWGHDWRQDYTKLGFFKKQFPEVPIMALTATATRKVEEDIKESLNTQKCPNSEKYSPLYLLYRNRGTDFENGARCERFCISVDRPNLQYEVQLKASSADDANQAIFDVIEDRFQGEPGIVYCFSKKEAENVAHFLQGKGIRAKFYHADLDLYGTDAGGNSGRMEVYEQWSKGHVQVVVATIAFGMGINKPDVRFVVHAGLPKSIESYYQETGRAGRDGDPAVAHLIWGGEDVARLRGFIAAGDGSDAHKANEARRMNALIAFLETAGCRRQELLRYFGETAPATCGNCDNCLNPPTLLDATEAARKLLSAVYRTGQRFGTGHLIEVLGGKATEKVQKFGHDRSSVFGIGKDWPADQWKSLARQLEAIDALERDPQHGGLVLGPAARPILKGEVAINLKQVVPRAFAKSAAKAGSSAAEVAPQDRGLFDELRALRRQLAADAGVPPYIVFADATLRAMAARRPQSMADMARIPGVGAVKLESWGPAFLAAITASAA